MTWEEVKALYASPVAEVGVHTVNHACLSRLNFDQQFSEISNCKKDLEKNLSTEMNLCSYPWGTSSDYTENTIGILKQLKFKAGIANIQSSCKQPYDAFQVPRRLVRNWDQKTFAKWLVDDQANNLEKNELDLRIKRLQGEIYEAAKNSAY